MRTGIANLTLDRGRCPSWLFEKMRKLAQVISLIIIEEFGTEEFLKRLSDPVWFQSFGSLLAFDWNASGLTTTTLAALKEALKPYQKKLGIFICGGKGKTSRNTPKEIQFLSYFADFDKKTTQKLEFISKAVAKIDNCLIQDGFNLYHHNFLFDKSGNWTVIQQGMNQNLHSARRYHWFSKNISQLDLEPHSGIVTSQKFEKVLNLTSKKSQENKKATLALIKSKKTFLANVKIIFSSQKTLKILTLPNCEFRNHPNLKSFIDSNYLFKIFQKIAQNDYQSYLDLLLTEGVGPKTIRALSLASEIIYGKKPSFEDPARYSFAHGGKDGTPYPVDRSTYDKTIEILEKAIKKSNFLSLKEKEYLIFRCKNLNFQILNPKS